MALKYGFVVGEFAEVVGDRGPVGDADRYPDQLGTAGSITFTPASASIIDSDAETGQMVFITPRAVEAQLGTGGQMVDKDLMRGQWLVIGQYQVKASFLQQPWTIVVTEEHTLKDPCDIVAQIPITPSPAVRFVLSEQTLIDAQAAADRAEAAAEAAEGAAGGEVVLSVNDRKGKVTLSAADVGLEHVDDTADLDKPVSLKTTTAINQALGGRVPVDRAIAAGTGLTGGGDLSVDRTLRLTDASVASLAKAETLAAALGSATRLGQSARDISNVDLNTVKDNGFYAGSTLGHSPNGDTSYYSVLVQSHTDNGWTVQTATEYATSGGAPIATTRTWRRVNLGGSWQSWVLISDSKGARFSATSNEGTSGDLNSVIVNGWTSGSGMTNAPTADFYYVQTQRVADAGLYVVQTAILGGKGGQSGDTYRRFLEGAGGWTSWVRISNYLGAIDQPARDTLATKITKGQQAIVYADIDPTIATAINNGAAAYSALSSKADVTALAAKADLVGGKIPSSQLPNVALGETFIVGSQAAMLALTAQNGDVAKRTDQNGAVYLLTGDPTVLANWLSIGAASGAVSSVNGYTGPVVLGKGDIGLANVDNTSDVNKPVSTAQATALGLKAPLASPTFTGTVSGITKAMVGLSNVDNTADTAKPVSTAQAAAIALKADLASPTLTGAPSAPTAAAGTNTGQLATTAFVMANATIGDAIVATSVSPGSTSTALNAAGSKSTRISLTAATTLTLAAGVAGVSYTHTLTLVQDATGGRTVTWPTNVKWRGSGTKPTLSTAANAIDLVTLYWSGTEWIGMFAADGVA